MTIEKLDATTPDLTRQNVARLAELFPECVTEGPAGTASDRGEPVIDFDLLRQALAGHLVEGPQERYRLDWPGKRQALLTANTPIDKTLRPMRKDSVDFDTTRNLFIEGDNLDALKLLQETYLGKIKMIYIDPPYNTGNDFIYNDKFSQSQVGYEYDSGQRDESGRLVANLESNGRFHSDWLSMMYPRLKVARNLLRDDGAIFVSIGQEEVQGIKCLLDEIFGSGNLVSICSRVMKTGGQKGTHFSPSVDYILIYAKSISELGPFREPISDNVIQKVYTKQEASGPRAGEKYRAMGLYQAMLDVRPNQRYFIKAPDGTLIIPPGASMPAEKAEGCQVKPQDGDGVWRWTYDRFKLEAAAGNIEFVKSSQSSLIDSNGNATAWSVSYKIWLLDRIRDGQLPGNILERFQSRHSSADLKALEIPFEFSKPVELIRYLATLIGVAGEDVVLDFFAGSGSTAHAVQVYNESVGANVRWLSVQLGEACAEGSEEMSAGFPTIASLARERIRRSGRAVAKRQTGVRVDIGFRAFRIDSGNLHDTRVAPDQATQGMLDGLIGHIKDDRSDEDLLFGALLRWGVDITLPVKQVELLGRTIWIVDPPGDGEARAALVACFARSAGGKGGIDTELADAIAVMKPLRVLFRDDGFAGDAAKENVASRFKQRAPDTAVKVL